MIVLRRPSCYSCVRVNTLRTTSDSVIEKLRGIIQDSGFNNGEMETVEHCNVNEGECGRREGLPDGTISKCEIPGLEYVLFVKGSGPHAIDYGPPPLKEVIVSRKCAEAVLRGAQVWQ